MGGFGFVIEALVHSGGEALAGAEVIEQQFAVAAQGAGEVLQRFDARAQGLLGPLVQDLTNLQVSAQ